LCGEKYLNSDSYRSGTEWSDDQPFLGADDYDLVGWTDEAPARDRHGYFNSWAFGSKHASVFNMAFCDGAVRGMSYDIEPTTHALLGGRNDRSQPTESFK
jgi:prepilin-type processing-associated H-X9-DG protein